MIRFKHCCIWLFLLFSVHLLGQQPRFKLFLVGDAGEDELTGETLDSLKSKLHNNPNSAVVFLGDNSYKNIFFGLIPSFKGFDSSRVAQRKMLSQLDILNGYKGSAYFVPGNHDWWNLTNFNRGKSKLKMEEGFIEANLKENSTIANPDATFFPKDGGPGPAVQLIDGGKVKLVFIDTDWLILLGFKSTPEANHDYALVFYHRLDSILTASEKEKQTTIIVAHHPVYSTGVVLAKPLKHPYLFKRIKQSFEQFPSYKAMADSIRSILEKHPGVYYACGHIHALQYHLYNKVHYLISGAGSKTNHVKGKNANTPPCNSNDCVLWNEQGFFEIDFYPGRQQVIMYHDYGRKNEKL